MFRIEQAFAVKTIEDLMAATREEIRKLNLQRVIRPKETVAIAVGSRGISGITEVLSVLVDEMKQLSAAPFLFPAMGSHGGANTRGQQEVLARLNITAKSVGAPIRSSMEVFKVGKTAEGFPLFIDRLAHRSNHIVVVNRIKPHPDFKASIESGLMKMIAIGIGKKMAAAHGHTQILDHGHHRVILSVARGLMKRCPIRFGLGIVENQNDEVALIRAIPAANIEAEETKLLHRAKAMLARIPFAEIDLLIVDQMGKDVAGTGMDQNVIGRSVIPYASVPARPKIKRIAVLDLTPATSGSAVGIGNADFTTRRLVDKIDRRVTYTNCITACAPEMARIPAYFDNDLSMIKAAVESLGVRDVRSLKIVHIKNTLLLSEMEISEALIEEAKASKRLTVGTSGFALKFDDEGNLKSGLAHGRQVSKNGSALKEAGTDADRFVW